MLSGRLCYTLRAVKKSFLLLSILPVFLAGLPLAYGEDALLDEYGTRAPKKSGGGLEQDSQLLNLEGAKLRQRLQDLERRIDQLERQDRQQEDRIRQLDRSVDDLKRRRLG